MKIKKIGFYNELSNDINDKIHLKDNIGKLVKCDKEQLVKYLNNGFCLVACGGMFPDYLDKESKIKLNHDFLTDGEYCWFRDLSYYVDKYNIAIDGEFISKISNKNFQINKDLEHINESEIELI